jgi:excisionase family DNA binding protein
METTHFDIEDCQFTVPEAAKHLRISRSSFYKLIAAKQIKVAKLGSRTVVPGAEVRRFVRAVARSTA